MTIDDLIEYLEHYRDEIGGDADVRLMTQQNWPMEYAICGLASQAEMEEQIEDEVEADAEVTDETEGDAEPVLYIVEGRRLGYGSKRAWDVAGKPSPDSRQTSFLRPRQHSLTDRSKLFYPSQWSE